jgi:hypothetical protein
MNNQDIAAVESKEQVLATPSKRQYLVAGQASTKFTGRRLADHIVPKDVDSYDGASQDVRGELVFNGLYFGKFRHKINLDGENWLAAYVY